LIGINNLNIVKGKFHLHDISLDIPSRSYCVLLGPTGAGKTLLMECIAGLRTIDSGSIYLNDRPVEGIKPEKRNIGYVPQDYALFPFMKVIDNITIGLKLRNIPSSKGRELLDRITGILDIKHLLDRAPPGLSGGEKQRVALARALISNPDVLLLDEPYSSLDAALRHRLWVQMLNLQNNNRRTSLHVTHDLEEAFTLGEYIAVMIDGKIQQFGRRETVFYKPANRSVAKFLEFHNIISGVVTGSEPERKRQKVSCKDYDLYVPYRGCIDMGKEVHFCIHPREIKIIREDRPIRESLIDNIFDGIIVNSIHHGMTYTLYFKISGSHNDYDFEIKVPIYLYLKLNLFEGKCIKVSLRKTAIQIFDD
jgi:ABC-type sugar transport system ATPase subunit